MIDSGLRSDHSIEMWEKILNGPLKSEKIHSLLITHYHPDHIGMAGWLQKKLDIKCYITEKELFTANTFRSMPNDEYAKIFRNVFVRAGMSEEDILAKGPATRLYKNRVYELPEFEIIQAGHEIESNDGLWIARTDSGHSPEHISLMDYKRKLYLSGDFLLPRISPNISDNFFDPLDDRLGGYFKYLNEISIMDDGSSVEVKIDEKNIAISKNEMRATKSTYLPTIGLVGSYGWNESINDNPYAFFNKNINDGFSGGINLSWDIFNSGRKIIANKNAKINYEISKIEKDSLVPMP